MMAVQAKWDFIGRERELAELEAVLRLPGVGQGELVLIGGEAGIGKTRLAEMAAESARRAGLQVAWAGCPEDRAVPAFWPWTQLLHAIVPDRTESTNAPAAEPLARLLRTPGIEPDAKENDPELARLQLFEAVAGQVRATAENRPLLLVLDDLHWADPSSIRLLAFVATMLRAIPAIVVGTYRDTEADPDSSFGEALPQLLRLGRKLSLAGLTAPEVGQLVTQLTGAQPSSETTVAIHQHTAGNPFFTRELVRLLETQEVLDRLGNGSIPQVGLPEGVRAVLRRRLARLSDQCRAVLAFGAALGQEFTLDPVQRVTGLASLPLLEYLDEAMAARLVHEVGVGRYAFSHAFTREAVYRELGLARRVRLHEQVGEALEALRGRGLAVEPVELAHHFRLAAPAGSAAKAVHYAVEAGDRAMAMLAHEDAVRLYESALAGLDLAPSAVDRAELLLALADARVAAGDLPGARQTYQQAAAEARTSGSPSQLARAALGMGSGPTGFEVALLDRSQLDLLEEALAALGDRPSALRAWVLARLSVALSYTDSVERRIVLSEAAVEVARRTGDTAALAYALSAHCDCIAGPAGCEQRLDETAEIVSLARTLGDRRMEMLGRRMRLVALLEVGDIAGADAEVEAYAHLAESVRQPLFQWYVPLWRGLRALMSGRLDEAERFAAEAASIGQRASSENAAVLSGGLQWFVLRERGDYRQAEELLGTAFDYMADLGIQAWVTVALARAEAGRLAEARALLDRGVAGEVAAAPLDSEWLPVIAQLTEAAAVLNGHPLAGQLYELLAPHRSRFTVEGIGCAYHGSVERHLGVLAALLDRRQSAAGHFEAALAANRRLGAPLLVAHTLRDWGRWLGERERLAEALAIYRELGLEFWARFMENLLGPGPVAEAGATPEGNVFRKEGDFWTVGFANRVARLKDAKGLRDLARLLAQPGREMHVLDLADGRGSRRGLDRASAAAQGLRAAGDSWEVIDAEAREAYKTRLGELDADLEEADRAGDIERSARAREERDALVAQLAAAYGLGGRARRSGDAAERARSAVTWRIRDALVRIEAAHPELGHHLRHSVRTGTFCVYDPEEPADWCL
jgi:tetratricopeptide (TPR) repeat protein